MQRTLIAVFDNHGDAQAAIDELVSSGFSRLQIRLSEGDPTGGASVTGTATDTGQASDPPRASGSFSDGIKNFLGSIFGTDNSEHVQTYSDAVNRGHHVLTLTAGNQSEAERACAIVEQFGPVDIDQRAAQWRGGAPQPQSQPRQQRSQTAASASQQSVQGSAADLQGGQAGGAQQRGSSGSGVKVFTHEAAATLNETEAAIEADEGYDAVPGVTGTGVGDQATGHQAAQTLNDTEAAIEADDDYYLGHYNSNYAASGDQYGHYAPAYKFGANMAASEQYRGRPWTDVNSELKRDWEGRNPGAEWDRFEASVRYGWDRGGV